MNAGSGDRSVAVMNIIVGIDGRDQKTDALALGTDLARLGGGRLLVTYVYPWSPSSVRLGAAYARTLREDAEQLLRDATQDLDGVDAETRAVPDLSTPRALHHLAEEEHADLIVVGSPHRGPVGRTLLGSTGERVMHGSPVPVAIAPRGYAPSGTAKRIGVAYDGSPEARNALSWASKLAAGIGATVTVLEVYEPVPVVTGYPGAGYPYDELDRTMREESRRELDEAVASLPAEVEPSGVMLNVPVAHALAEAANDLDLLVMGSRGYGPQRAVMLGGVAHALSHTSPCPVIVLPRGAAVDDEAIAEHAAAEA